MRFTDRPTLCYISRIITLVLCFIRLTTTTTTDFDSVTPSDRRKCQYFEQSGCLLTVMEDICEAPENVIQHSDLRYSRFSDRCCCPRPFEVCSEEEKDVRCKNIFNKYITSEKDKAGPKEKVLAAYNNIRKELLETSDECKHYLSSTSEPVQCQLDGSPPPFSRKDHQCELLLWSYEELAFRNKKDLKEIGCSYEDSSSYRKKKKDVVKRVKPDDDDEANNNVKQQIYNIASYNDRRLCKYWQQNGCLLDVMEKVCEGNDVSGFFAGEENMFLCCCPNPYQPCKRSEADVQCLQKMERQFPKSVAEHMTSDALVEGLQTVRKELFQLDRNCQEKLAPTEPFAVCSRALKPFSRHDLKCEMLLWQWEELGDGDRSEFERIKCPYVKKDKSKNGEERKGGNEFLPEESKTEL